MTPSSEDQRAFEALELRIKTILPEEYQDSYEDLQPVSMGSAALKFGRDGKVAWGDIWETFCDLAMAGGPPHKGKLLEPASREAIQAQPDRYNKVVGEICRGVSLVSGLPAEAASNPGWVRVECTSLGMAGWLLRAIAMENVSVYCEDTALHLPAGPAYRVEKEIKNVVTVIAKTTHYWTEHMWAAQQRVIADLFTMMEAEVPLIQPALPGHDFRADANESLRNKMALAIREATGVKALELPCAGWLGLISPDVRSAIWMMRALVASNVLSRREGTTLFVPVNAVTDPSGSTVVRVFCQIHGFAKAKGVL